MKTRQVIILADHEPAALQYRLEAIAMKQRKPAPAPIPPRTWKGLDHAEALKMVHIPSKDARDVEAILSQLGTTPAPAPKAWPTASRRA